VGRLRQRLQSPRTKHFCRKHELLEVLAEPRGEEWYRFVSRRLEPTDLANGSDSSTAGGTTPMDSATLDELLECGTACFFSAAAACIHWPLGAIDEELFDDSFSRLHQLVSELTKVERTQYKDAAVPFARVVTTTYSQRKLSVEEWKNLEKKTRAARQGAASSNDRQESRNAEALPELHNEKVLHESVNKIHGLDKRITEPKALEHNYLRKRRNTRADGNMYAIKLQLVHANQSTTYHRDNGSGDTWIKVLSGEAFVACWSLHDGLKYDLHEGTWRPNGEKHGKWSDFVEDTIDWRKCMQMPSFRCCLVVRDEVLLMPAGTFHYIFTTKTKAVIAGDYCSGARWHTRIQSREQDDRTEKEDSGSRDVRNRTALNELLLDGLRFVECGWLRAETAVTLRLAKAKQLTALLAVMLDAPEVLDDGALNALAYIWTRLQLFARELSESDDPSVRDASRKLQLLEGPCPWQPLA